MSYAKVENGTVVKEGACPVNLKNPPITGFYQADNAFKITHGYYPVVTVSPSKKVWQVKDENIYSIKETNVEKTITYTNQTLENHLLMLN